MSTASKSDRFLGFGIDDPFAVAANRESAVVFSLGAVPWPTGFAPQPLPLGQFTPGKVITGPVNFIVEALVILYTDLETRAFLDVFNGPNEWDPARKAKWYPYGYRFDNFKSQIEGINDRRQRHPGDGCSAFG